MISPLDHPSYDVFLAHGNGDCEAVQTLARRLVDADVRTFVSEGHEPSDARREAELAKAVNLSICIAFCLGSATLEGQRSDPEMQVALAQASRARTAFRVVAVLLPGARVEEVRRLPGVQSHVDFRAGLDDDGAFARLVAEVTRPRIRRLGRMWRIAKPAPAPTSTSLRVFLCHSSGDKEVVRRLHHDLRAAGHRPWLDEEDLLPGQAWELEIAAAIRRSDVVLVCLSAASVSKSGFVQKELRFALDVADEQPEGAIFLIPVMLEPCEVPPRLRRLHWVDLFAVDGMEKLYRALDARARDIERKAGAGRVDALLAAAEIRAGKDARPAPRQPGKSPKCTECGAMGEEDWWFCKVCGAELPF